MEATLTTRALAFVGLLLAALLGACRSPTPGPDTTPRAWSTASLDERCAVDKALATEAAPRLAEIGLGAATIDKLLSFRTSDALAGRLETQLNEDELARLLRRVEREPTWACGRVPVRLVAFNDFHGQLEPPTGRNGEVATPEGPVAVGGVEFMATWVESLKKEVEHTFVVSAGDNIGATPLISAAFHDEPTIEALDALGLHVSSVGNHEFDEGIVELTRMQNGGCHPTAGCFGDDGFAGARFRYLAANVVKDLDGRTLFPAVSVRRAGGAEVAFIGMTLEGTPTVVTAAGVAGVSFLDEALTVNRLVPDLVARGIETIVVLLHEGGFTTGSYDGCEGISGPVFDVVRAFDPEVDVVVTGHTNAAHVCDIDGRLVTSASYAGRMLTEIDLVVDEVSGDVVDKRAKNVLVRRDVAKAPALTAIVERYGALVKTYAEQVVTTLAGDLTRAIDASGQSALGWVIADAQLAAEADASAGGAEVALMNPGGIRADLQAGAVTYGELFVVQPFSNNLVTMTLSGRDLEALLEEQFQTGGKAREHPKMLQVSATLAYTWDPKRPAGDKIATKDIRVGGKALDPERPYRVVVNNFLAGGGDSFATLTRGTDRKNGIIDLDALELYLKARPGLAAPIGPRVRRR